MKNINKTLIKFYARRTWKLEFVISLIFVIILIKFNLPTTMLSEDYKTNFLKNMGNLNTFFGIFVGFLLTTFSFLYSIQPSKNSNLGKIRSGSTYKKMLYSILTTSLFLVFLILILIFSDLISENFQLEIILFLIIFGFLRIFRTIFYLFYILIIE